MLTDRGDSVVDPFAGSCVTGEVCERLARKWTCVEMREEYLRGALGRFERPGKPHQESMFQQTAASVSYRLQHPAALWNGNETPLEEDGGKTRKKNACDPA
jgi:site-specific DNA-methyltransferase (cytosine-N4-specific)